MRVRSPAPLGSPGDRPDPEARTRFPTTEPFPVATDRYPADRDLLYARVKHGPITASEAARLTKLTLPEARDVLRIMESSLLVRHTVDDVGVLRWKWNPSNYLELDPVPF